MNPDTTNLILEMRGVSKCYPHFTMKDFNLSLPEGEIMGIIGPNGAGKTTCLRLLMGFIKADAGRICVLGKDVSSAAVEIKQQAAYVSEDMRLFEHTNLAWHMDFVSRLYPSWDQLYADNLVKRFDLKVDQKIKGFSLGERVKATLLLAMARRPKLLVLDEPSTGLDPVARHELTSELFEIMLNEDHSVLFSSQHTQDVERLSDTIAFMDGGELISCQDKESYIEQWKRLVLSGGSLEELVSMRDIAGVEQQGSKMLATLSNFSSDSLASFNEQGFTVDNIFSMTLEEIFIAQVLHRKSCSSRGLLQ